VFSSVSQLCLLSLAWLPIAQQILKVTGVEIGSGDILDLL
jgi:uncharacterized membrane protein